MPLLQFSLDDRQAAFDRTFRIAKDALAPFLDVKITDDGKVFPLTGATPVTFNMDSEAGVAKIAAVAGIVKDAVAGTVRYIWTGTDTNTPGKYFGQFAITLQSGEVLKVPNNSNQKLIIIVGDTV